MREDHCCQWLPVARATLRLGAVVAMVAGLLGAGAAGESQAEAEQGGQGPVRVWSAHVFPFCAWQQMPCRIFHYSEAVNYRGVKGLLC